jgi:hypothetical protein
MGIDSSSMAERKIAKRMQRNKRNGTNGKSRERLKAGAEQVASNPPTYEQATRENNK